MILVCSPDAPEVAALLRRGAPGEEIRQATVAEQAEPWLGDVEILYAGRFPWPWLARMPRLRWIQKMAAGVEDIAPRLAALAPGVRLTRLGGVFGPRMAEYVLAYLLALRQDLPRVLGAQAERRWERFVPGRIAGRTLGVAGAGDIGACVAGLAVAAGMRAVGWRRTPGSRPPFARVYAGEAEKAAFLDACDDLALVLPHTPQTVGTFGEPELGRLGPDASVINVGRGSALDSAALARLLAAGRLRGAALDVHEVEPLPPDDPIWTAPRCIVSAHLSGPNAPAETAPPFLDNLARFRGGRPLRFEVDLGRGY